MVAVRPIAPLMRDRRAWDSALRPKKCLLMPATASLRDIVASKLILDWSPEQISGWLETQYPDDESLRVSHETIYRSLFIQARRSAGKKSCWTNCARSAACRPLAPCQCQRTVTRTNRPRCRLHPRKTCGGGRPERFPAIGKGICWPVPRTPTLPLWWSAIRALPC